MYSKSAFSININILYGNIIAKVYNPSGKEVDRKTINDDININVDALEGSSNNIDYFDSNSRYVVEVQAVADASYFIIINKKESTKTIYEGVPITLNLQAAVSTNL